MGNTRTTVSHLRTLNLVLRAGRCPWRGLESVSRGDQMCIFTFVAGFEPCRDKPDMGKPVGRLLKLRDAGGWHTLSLGLSSP